jgi:predicted small lipoprotein YifL
MAPLDVVVELGRDAAVNRVHLPCQHEVHTGTETGIMGYMLSRLPLWLVIASTALAMAVSAGCGVRGPLDAPPKSAADAPPSKPGEPTPHRPSILDPLIR